MTKTKMKVMKGLAVTAVLALSLIATGGDAYAKSNKKAPAPAPAPKAQKAPAPAPAPTAKGISWEGISWD